MSGDFGSSKETVGGIKTHRLIRDLPNTASQKGRLANLSSDISIMFSRLKVRSEVRTPMMLRTRR